LLLFKFATGFFLAGIYPVGMKIVTCLAFLAQSLNSAKKYKNISSLYIYIKITACLDNNSKLIDIKI